MTGLEALQALLVGKRVVNNTAGEEPGRYAVVANIQYGREWHKEIVWKYTYDDRTTYTVPATAFLSDDWEVIE